MSDELFFDGTRYISAADAADISNLTRDYIARLARSGKVVGRQVGRQWYVSQESLRSFLLAQEYANSQRRGALAKERQQEYVQGKTTFSRESKSADERPSSRLSETPKVNADLHRKLAEAAMRGTAHVVSKATAIANNASAQVPLYAVTPSVEFLHKIAAAVLALALVVGLYSAGGSLLATSPQFVPGTKISPQVEFTATAGFLGDTFGKIADAFQTGADAFLAPFFGAHLAQGNTSGVVSLSITQHPSSNPVFTAAQSPHQTIINNNPVVDRVIESEQIISSGGITEDELSQKLQQLDNELSDKIYTATAANSTVIAQNYNVTAQTNAIDQLTDTAIYNPTISGGSINGTSVNATYLSVSDTGTSTFAGGIDLAGGCFAVNGTCISGGGGGSGNPGGSDTQVQYNDNGVLAGSSSFTFASSTATLSTFNFAATNATSTTFFATIASSTNLFAENASFGTLALVSALPISSGGTGIASAPSYGQVLVGNASGGYNLIATSSLGIVVGGGSSNVSTSSQNTWSALQIFAGGASTTNLSVFNNAYFGGSATSSFNSSGQLTLAGISNSLLSTDANGQVVATTSIGTNLLTGTLGVGQGGTGSTTLSGILVGNGTSPVQTAVVSSPLSLSGNTLSISQANGSTNGFLSSADWAAFNNKVSSTSLSGGAGISYNSSTGVIANTGVTSFAQTNGTAQTGAITIGTSTLSFNGLTAGDAITNSGGTFTVTPTLSGTLDNSGLTHSSITVNGTSISLGSSGTISAASSSILTDNNTFSGANTFTQTIAGSVAGNAGTATALQTARNINGVSFNGTSDITIFAASSTLLANNNSWTGLQNFANASTTFGTISTLWLPNIAANSLLKTNANGQVSAAVAGTDYVTPGGLASTYPFPLTGNATSTLTQFNGGLTAYATSTIGDGTRAGGLTINGGATTTATSTLSGLIVTSGNVGIGTTNPAYALDVSGTIKTTGGLVVPTDNTWLSNTGGVTIATTNNFAFDGSRGQENWQGNATFALKVGVGTTTPAAKLDVAGTLGSQSDVFNVSSTTATNVVSSLFKVQANGNVGIGTTSPTNQLEVAGNTFLGGNLTATGTVSFTNALGVGSGGTGSTTLSGILKGNGTGAVQTAVGGTDYEFPLTFSTGLNRTGNTITNTGVLNIGSGYATTTGTAITFSTTTATVNGVTYGVAIAPTGSSLTFTPTISGTLDNSGLTHSSITVNGTSISLGSSGTISAASSSILTDNNTFSGTNAFTNPITISSLSGLVGASSGLTYAVSTTSLNASITGSAGSVGNAVTFNSSGGASPNTTFNGSSAITVDYHTLGAQVAGTYLTGLGNYATTTASAISLSTSTVAFQGATFGQTIVASPNGLLFTPTITGTLTAASSSLLIDNNTFSGNDTFSNLITGSISGNAGTVTNGVYTTTFGTLFDNRLSATTTLPSITTLANLATVGTITSGTWAGSVIGSNYGGAGSVNGLLKANGSGIVSQAIAGTDYINPSELSASVGTAYPFQVSGNATSTLTQFNGGLTAYASSTIGNGTQGNGLTISGGATTTGNSYFGGNVGIGTQSPSSLLSINYAFGGTAPLTISQSGTPVFSVDHSGLLTSNPATAVSGGSLWSFGAGVGQVFSGGIAFDINPYSVDSSSYLFRTAVNNSTKFIINGSGQVGIGTVSPSYLLDVNGAGHFTSLVDADHFVATSSSVASLFNGGFFSAASSTIGNGTQSGGLTISGGATTTGNSYVGGRLNVSGQTTLGNASTSLLTVAGNSYLNNTHTSTLALGTVLTCTGSQALQTDGSGNISCGTIAIGGASSGGGWTTNNSGLVGLSTTTDQVTVGASSTPYAKLTVLSGNTATTTLALVAASGQSANLLDIYDSSGALNSVFTSSGSLGLGTTSPGSILSINGVGNFVNGATSTLYHGLNITSGCVSVNGTCIGSTAASSTLLIDNNTFAGSNTFTSSINGNISGNAGTATALQNARTINGVSFNGTANIVINAASSTLLADNNSWTGLQSFANASSTLTTLGTTWFSGISNALLATNANGQVVATTSIGTNLLTGTLGVGNGGTELASTPSYGQLLVGNGSGYTLTATSSLGLPQFSDLASQIAAAYEFPQAGNGTSTLAQFNGGLTAYATSTIGNGTQTGGLTISGGATTTGNGYVGGALNVAGNTTLANATTTNLFSTTASSTNLFAQTASFGTLSLGTPLAVGSGGTGQSTLSSGQVLLGNGSSGVTSVARGSLTETGSSILSITGGTNAVLGSGLTIQVQQANGSQSGFLSSTDWTSFNNKAPTASPTFTGTATFANINVTGNASTTLFSSYGPAYFGSTATSSFSTNGALTLATQLTVPNGGTGSTTLTGILKGNGTGAVQTAVGGTDYEFPLTFSSGLNRTGNTITNTGVLNIGSGYATTTGTSISLSTTTQTFNGLTIAQTISTPNGSNVLFTPSVTGTLDNSGLTHSTISGVALGNNLNSLSHDSTLSGTSYNGSASVSDWGLNLGNANAWTGLQTFQNASSTNFSNFGTAYFGGTATSSFSSTGALTLATALTVPNGGTGQTSFSSSQLLYGAGSGALQSVATTTAGFSGPFTISGTLGSLIGGSNSTITWTGLATTSNLTAGQLLYSNGGAGVTSVATGTVSSGSGISVTAGQSIIGSGLTITNTGVTSNVAGTGISVSGPTGAVTITNTGVTSIAGTANQITASASTGGVTLSLPSLVIFPNSASTTNLSVFGNSYFGGTATSSFNNAGQLTLAGLTSSLLYANSGNQIAAVTVASPLTFSSGNLGIQQANGSQNGYLSSSDWSNFNSKVSSTSLSGASVISYTPSTGVITTTGGTFGAGNYTFPANLTVNGNASTTLFSAYGPAYFGGTATSSFSTTGALTLATALTVPNGGTGSTTLSGLLKGNGTGQVQTAVGGTDYEFPLTFSTGLNRTGNTITNTGVLNIGSGYATTTATGITLSTTTQTFNGLTIAQTISTPNGSDILFTPNVSGTLDNSGLTHSSITLSNGGGLTVSGSPVSLGGTATLSLDLTHANNWTGLQTFQNASSSNFSNFGTAYFGGTATSSFNSTGTLTLAGLTNSLLYTNGSNQVAAVSVASPLTFSAGSLGIQVANGSQNGYLASADWSNFNNKVSSTSLSGASVISYTSSTGVITTAPGTFGGSGTYTFPNGIIAPATSTIGVGTQTGGLTVSGGATTTGSALIQGTLNVSGTGSTLKNGFTNGSLYVGWNSQFGIGNFGNGSIISFGGADGNATTTILNGLTVNGNSLVVQTVTGNVGIGTTSPLALLSISNSVATAANTPLFVVASTTGGTATTTLFSISNTGTTTAANGFNITAGCFALNGNCLSNISLSGANTWTALQTFSAGASTTNISASGEGYFGTASTTNLIVGTPSSILSTNSSGQVGALSIGASLLFSGNTLSLNTGNGNTWTALQQFAAGASTTLLSVSNGSATTTLTAATSTFAGGITLTTGCVFYNGSCIGANAGSVGGGTQGQFAFYQTNGTTVVGTSTLFVTPAGNVGIGTVSPGLASGANQYLTIASNGANTQPSLELSGDTNVTGNPIGRISFYNQTGATEDARISTVIGSDTSNGSLVFSTGQSGVVSEVARIDQNGNLGIGTTSPGSLLSVGNTNGINFTEATSSFSSTGGINLKSGCFAINGTCVGAGGGGVSLSSPNTWTALQTFAAGASTTNFSNFGTAYFGGTATSSFSTTGALTLATALTVPNGGTGSTTLSGLLKGNGTGSILTAVAGTDYLTPAQLAAAYPFPLTGNATSTLTQFNNGLTAFASSTIGNGIQAGGLTINGGATTTGNAYFGGNLTVAHDSSNFLTTSVASNGFTSLFLNGSGASDHYGGYGSDGTGLYITAQGPAATSTNFGLGVNATSTLYVQGAPGGDNTGVTTVVYGGQGGGLTLVGGIGGKGDFGTSFALGGQGGDINIAGGIGGPTNSGATDSAAGRGGDLNLNGGTGGTGITGDGGPGGYVQIIGGTGSTGALGSGDGGSVTIAGGEPGDSSRYGGGVVIYGGGFNTTGATIGDVYLASDGLGDDIGNLYIGTTSAYTTNNGFLGIGSTTPGSLLSLGTANGINFSEATSSFSSTGGINLKSGCFAINGTCVGAGGGGVSLSSPNTWTALQTFAAGASTTNFSNFGTAYFGGTATSSFSTTGALTLATALTVPNGGTGSTTLSGLLKGNGTGSILTAVAGTDYLTPAQLAAAYPFPLTGNATSTLTQFNGGLTAYGTSTIGSGSATGGLTINGNATTTGNAYFLSQAVIGAESDFADSLGPHALSVTSPDNKNAIGIQDNSGVIKGGVYLDMTNIPFQFGTISNSSFGFYTDNNDPQFALYTNGAAGIGTTYGNDPSGSIDLPANGLAVQGSVGIGTTTPGSILSIQGVGNFVGGATSTLYQGLNITSGCFAINGTCVGGGAGGGITALGSGYATTTGTTITFSTSTLSFNGLTLGQTIAPSAGTLLFTPTVTGTLSNAGLANSTISGISLGSNLNSLTATDGTLTFSGAYNGSAARTIGLNLGNANTWTGLQQFAAGASTTQLSVFTNAYFGGTATSSFSTTGALTLATALTVPNGGTGSTTLSGLLKGNGTGSILTAVAGTDYLTPAQLAAAYPFPLTGNATSTLTQFNNGLTAFASSTIGNGIQAGGLTINGGATTTGNAYFGGNLTVAHDSSNFLTTSVASNGFTSLFLNGSGASDQYGGYGSDGTGLYITAQGPAATSTTFGLGVNATSTLYVQGAPGGDNTGVTTSVYGGQGGGLTLVGGIGGKGDFGTTFALGGQGGDINIAGGIGGPTNSGATVSVAGRGGDLNLNGGTGGTGITGDGGQGGYVQIIGGTGSTGALSSGDGGSVTIAGGEPGDSSSYGGGVVIYGGGFNTTGATIGDVYLASDGLGDDIGNLYIGTTSAYTTNNGFLGIGSTTPGSLLSLGTANGINFSEATSSFSSTGGINLKSGCFAINGTCVGAGGGGVSLSSPNTWTALQTFAAGASTTNFSNFGTAYFGGTATSSFSTTGALTLATALTVPNGGTGSTTLSGLLKGNGTGSILTAVAGTDYLTPAQLAAAYPFPLTGNATSTLTQFNGGLTAYGTSTIGSGSATGGLTINGNATTTGNAYFLSQAVIGAESDFADSLGPHALSVTSPDNKNAIGIQDNSGVIKGGVYLDMTNIPFQFGTISNSSFGFYTDNNDPQFALYTNGAAGIGTTYGNDPSGSIDLPANGLAVQGSVGIGTTTPGSILSIQGVGNFVGGATSTLYQGLNITSGCFAINGTCVGGGAGGGITALGSGYATTTGTTITFSTSTLSFNGLTLGQTIAPSAGTLLFTPTVTGTLSNAGLANSTISGISLGSNLNSLTATDGTLTFSGAYNGSAARTIGLNLGNANTWTGLQQFAAGASTTQLSVFTNAYFGGTATSSFSSTGVLTLASPAASSLLWTNGSSQVAAVTVAGSLSFSSGTLSLNTGNANTWSALQQFNSGLTAYASSTIGNGTATGGLTISGGATTTGTAYFAGNVGIGTSSPYAALSIQNAVGSTTLAVSTTDTSSNLFEVATSSGTAYFDITAAGLIGVGSTSPESKFTVSGGGACFSGTGTTLCGNSAGNIYYDTANTGNYDLAENYVTSDASATPGTIMMLDPANAEQVITATSSVNVLGVVSSNPGIILGGADASLVGEKVVPIALSGRVPVQVSFGNGPIVEGDRLALSTTTPGVAVKALESGEIIGVALQSIASAPSGTTTTPTIDVFVQPQYFVIAGATSTPANLSTNFFSSASSALQQGIASIANSVVHLMQDAVYATVGVFQKVYAQEVHTDKLCVSDSTGETCITRAQLNQLLANASSGSSSGNSSSGSNSSGGGTTSGSTSTAPIIQVNGSNPATVNVGANYSDLGATITGPTADLNLGITASVDGATSTPLSSISVDTSVPGTHTIVYSATDQNGLVGTASREVDVVALPSDSSGDSSATSTDSGTDNSSDASSTDASTTTP